MNDLILNANALLKNRDFEYAVCGGFAIELFLNKEIRKHGDIDISVYWNDRDKIILYMQSLGWNVYEMCGNGIVHHITDINQQIKVKRNIFCFNNDCKLVTLTPHKETDMYYLEFDHNGQTEFNFIEFLFNEKSTTNFIYARNKELILSLSKAVLNFSDIPYLAPELVLLYKSTDILREGYQQDFDLAIIRMSSEQKNWLKRALLIMNPLGHKWIADCK